MVHERSIVIYITGGHFPQESLNKFQMKPKHMDRPTTRISYFALKFSLTRFFPKDVVNFNFLRQNKYDKIRPIISYNRHNVVNTDTKSAQIVLKSPQKNTIRFLPTSFRTLVRRYSCIFDIRI